MTPSFLRSALMIGLLAGAVAGCGDKASYPINVNIVGLALAPLELADTVSGQKLVVNEPGARTVAFANSIEYGTEYNITAKAPHQDCQVNGGTDSAGRRESVQIDVLCTVQTHIISLPITTKNGAVVTGLQLANGSDTVKAFTATESTTSHSFVGLPYNASFSVTILAQPTGVTCKFVAPTGQAEVSNITDTAISGTMGDRDLSFAIECTK